MIIRNFIPVKLNIGKKTYNRSIIYRITWLVKVIIQIIFINKEHKNFFTIK